MLTVDQRRLAEATKRAVRAAGGGKVCEAEAGVPDSSLSRYGSKEDAAFIPIDRAVRIDAIGAREAGYPHILGTMASCIGAVVIMLPEPVDGASSLQMSVVELTTELGDVARAIGESFSGTSAGGAAITPVEADAALHQVADLERATAKLRHQLERIAAGRAQPP